MEYKSPDDNLDIDSFYKAGAYGCLYKACGKTVDERAAEDITVSIVRDAKPEGLFRYFREHNIRVTNPYAGIYYVLNEVLFRTQIIVGRELRSHMWIKALSDRMEKQEMRNLLEKIMELTQKFDRELADSVLEVSIKANKRIVEELRGDDSMCQALLEIMEPEINKEVNRRVENEVNRRIETEARSFVLRSVKSFRELNADNEAIKEMLVKNYGLAPKEAEEYLQEAERELVCP